MFKTPVRSLFRDPYGYKKIAVVLAISLTSYFVPSIPQIVWDVLVLSAEPFATGVNHDSKI